MLGIIGGSGFYELAEKENEKKVETPYGDCYYYEFEINGNKGVFVPRHGKKHSVPPHIINYRANIYALKKLGVDSVFATYATGIMEDYKPGDLILLRDFIGMEIPVTFFNDFSGGMKHTDFTEPFSPELIEKVKEAAGIHGLKLKDNGIIKTTPGPRFESKAEIKVYKNQGANLISMTAFYEIVLINEMEIPFSGLAIGTNYACGISKNPLSQNEVLDMMKEKEDVVRTIARELVTIL